LESDSRRPNPMKPMSEQAPPVMPHRERNTAETDRSDHGIDFARVGFVALAAAAVWFRVWEPFPRISPIGVVAILIGGWPIFKEALENVLERRMTMELSMAIAVVAAAAIGELFTALVITLFVLVAEILEGLTVARGRRAIQDFLDLLPRLVTVRGPQGEREISSEKVRVGDVLLVRPGGRVPVDGVVVDGHSYVDQATITGESMPVEKSVDSVVYAGTINQSGALDVRADRLGRDTSFGKIVEAVETAERSRAPVQKIADRLAGYLVYFALVCAGVTFIVTRNPRTTISVVIVAGACGIAAGTPLAILGGIGRAARRGAIVKGGLYLEVLAAIDTVVFDKTGTLTYGKPEVQEVCPAAGFRSEDVLAAAAFAEQRSEHPLAQAILAKARDLNLPLENPETFVSTPGRGVIATVNGEEIVVGNRAFFEERGISLSPLSPPAGRAAVVLVARGGRSIGSVTVADTIRPEARDAVAALHDLGLRTVLLTGDATRVATAVGQTLGVDECVAELLPDGKSAYVRNLVAEGRRVAMVGDGVNDAPALMAASVGIAMGSGTDVAREAADVVLLGNDLSKLVDTVRLARRTRGIILQNFVGTLTVDAIGVGLAAMGILTPLLAASVHVTSELGFILNSARLLPASRLRERTTR
jgi:heavy metal translocating P-type ATPase